MSLENFDVEHDGSLHTKIDPHVLLAMDPNRRAVEDLLPDEPLEEPDKSYFEGLFPKGQVHLFGGPSGAGKTTLAFEMYKALSSPEDGEWLGRKTINAAWAYISGDRASNSVYQTQKRVGVDFKVFSLVDHELIGADLTTDVFLRLPDFYGYRPNFIYIDGFTSMVPGGKLNEYVVVAKWLANLQMYCQRKNMTIIGACHTTKVKEGEQFTEPRQRIAGSVAWAAYSESVVIIEPSNKKNPSKRSVLLLPRNSGEDKLEMEFSSTGNLVLSSSSLDDIAGDQFILSGLLDQMNWKVGDEKYYMALWGAASAKKINKRTFGRWLKKLCEEHVLGHVRRGIYRRLL